jgi:hypothetical protein
MTPPLTGAPAVNPQTGSRRYTGAEFIVRLAEIHRLGTLAVPQLTRKARRKP